MSVQFILGRSGTGKTFHCISAIADILAAKTDHAPIVLLVPEQATYQAERAILADRRIAGYTNLHILSFERLQYMLIGRNYAKSDLSRIGQEMIIRKILCSIADKLDVFHNTASTPGLAEKLTSTIIELHRCAKTPVDLQSLAADLQTDSANSLTARKFADIATIYESYLRFIADKFINPDIQLTKARDHVDTADFMQNPQAAADAPRWKVMPDNKLLIEQSYGEHVLKTLADRGHDIEVMPHGSQNFGAAQLIRRLDYGYAAASEPRRDGQAAGF